MPWARARRRSCSYSANVLDTTPSSPRAIDRTLRRLADQLGHAHDDEYARSPDTRGWRDDVEEWERLHRGYVEEEMMAHKRMQWAERALAAGRDAVASLRAMMARVSAEVAELDKKIDKATVRVQGVGDYIEDIK